jgi:hypothetical protein
MQLNVSSDTYSPDKTTDYVFQSLKNDTSSADGELQQAVGAPVTLQEVAPYCSSGCGDTTVGECKSKNVFLKAD